MWFFGWLLNQQAYNILLWFGGQIKIDDKMTICFRKFDDIYIAMKLKYLINIYFKFYVDKQPASYKTLNNVILTSCTLELFENTWEKITWIYLNYLDANNKKMSISKKTNCFKTWKTFIHNILVYSRRILLIDNNIIHYPKSNRRQRILE